MADESLIARLHAAWSRADRADDPALADERGALSYAKLVDRVGTLAGRLHAAGVRRGDRVGLAFERSIELPIALLATLAAGACAWPLEPRLSPDETRRRLDVARARWVLGEAAQLADAGLADLPPDRLLDVATLAPAAPSWTLDAAPDDAALLFFTSGSTGASKGVLQAQRGLVCNAFGIAAHAKLTRADRLLHLMPMHHVNGVHNQLLAPLLAGASVFVAPRFRAEEMPALFARTRPTIVTGVPTMYARMLPFEFADDSLAALRMLRCGSAPITPELHRRIEQKFGRPLVVSYGLSEATCTSTMNPPEARVVGSVGTALAGQRVFLAAADGTPIDEAGRDGEICIAGAALMLGYLVDGSDGEPVPPADAIHTGDLGRFDADGHVYITGRLKDVIIRGGENLSPQLIENVLCETAEVAGCCVVGRPDDDLGEVPVAYVVRANAADTEATLAEALARVVVERLSRIHRPVAFVFVDALPETAMGKVDRKRLAARAAAKEAA